MCLASETKGTSYHSSWTNRNSLSFSDSERRGLGQQEGEVPFVSEEQEGVSRMLSSGVSHRAPAGF